MKHEECGGEAHLLWYIDGNYHFKCDKCSKNFIVTSKEYYAQ